MIARCGAARHYPPYMVHKGGEFQNGHISAWFGRFDYARREGWSN
jgi:hypothetical protein